MILHHRAAAFVLGSTLALGGCQRSPHGHGDSENHATVAPSPSASPARGPLEHGAHAPSAMPSSMPSGYAAVTLDARSAGLPLTTAKVEERDFQKLLRTVGVIALDETRTAHVHTKVRGWIQGIRADFVGKTVRAGDVLCDVYSQEVYAAELEYLALVERTRELRKAPSTELAAAAQNAKSSLIESARDRLTLWDVPEDEVARLERTREPSRTFPLRAPKAGTVVAKRALEGMFVDPAVELFTVSDLSRVWALADIYEVDAPYVRVGVRARLAIEGRPAPLEAPVSFLPPTMDEATRTLKARFDLDNRGKALRIGAFVSVELLLPLGRGLAVPESAVIRTGQRAILFVVHGNEVVPHEVILGPLVGDAYRVDGGVVAGALVATGAQFLLDSESRLRASRAPGGGHVH